MVFGLEKFHQYTYGRKVTVQTDHKLLEAIVKIVHVQPDQLPDNRGLLLWVLGDRPSRKHYSQSQSER